MQFFTTIVLAAAGVIAAPSADLCARELTTVNTIMTTVLNGIQSLDGSILAYTGGPGTELQDASATMLEIIRNATNNAAAMLPLSTDEAIAFQPLSDQLNAAGDKLLVDLESKVPIFAQSDACPTALSWVAQVGSNVNTLMVTISTKFPAGGKGGDEIAHFNGIFTTMQEKLTACDPNATVDDAAATTTKAAVPAATGSTTVHGNATAAGTPAASSTPTGTGTGNSRPVVTAGASFITFSGAGIAAAIAAFVL